MKTIKLLILMTLSIGLLCTSCKKEEAPVIKEGEFGLIYLDENGVTIKAYDIALVGDTDILDGITYTVIDSAMLYSMVDSVDDYSSVVTTLVRNMAHLNDRITDFDFNQDISKWDVGKVASMGWMFCGTNSFNQDISNWDVSNVTNMYAMFRLSLFNQDLSIWDVRNVEHCSEFSDEATSWTLPKPNFTNCDCGCE
jgi:surface protein